MTKSLSLNAVEMLLPQTQCGLCGYGGCLPYAKALIEKKANINLCPPGGIQTLKALGDFLGIDSSPYIDELKEKSKPKLLAIIEEAECIGCTKCIQACPVDAIIGSAKKMHTVINNYCTGCELCIPSCPVDCITMKKIGEDYQPNEIEKRAAKSRYENKSKREKNNKLKVENNIRAGDKLNYLNAAIQRAKQKRQNLIDNGTLNTNIIENNTVD